MREILFRGKTTLDNEWVIGAGVYKSEGHTWIITDDVTKTESRGTGSDAINPETVGQFTGLTDKDGKKIFEGDIVLYARDEELGQISYHESEAMFVVEFDTWLTDFDHMYGKDLEIIGNIHDNPELLKGGEG